MNTSNEQRLTMERSGVDKNIQLGGLNTKNNNVSEPLPQHTVDNLLGCLPVRANQARRFVKFVAESSNSKTANCNVAVAGVNLSDIARKYNPYLKSEGFQLKCQLPHPLIKNRFGEDSMQHLWKLAEVMHEC